MSLVRLAPNVSKYIGPRPIEKSRLGVILIKCLTGSMLRIRPIYVTPFTRLSRVVAAQTDKREACCQAE